MKDNNLKNTKRTCRVVRREITIEEAMLLLNNQKGNATPNQRENGESAFGKALRGSQCFLKHKKIIK